MFRILLTKFFKLELRETVLKLKKLVFQQEQEIQLLTEEKIKNKTEIEEFIKRITSLEALLKENESSNNNKDSLEHKTEHSKHKINDTTPNPHKREHLTYSSIIPTKPEPRNISTIPTESISFENINNHNSTSFINPKIDKILKKLAIIGLHVEYIDNEYVYIKDGDFQSPLKDRFSNLDIYGDSALVITDTKGIHAAFSLITGKRIGRYSSDKKIVISSIEEFLYDNEKTLRNVSNIKDISYYVMHFNNLITNKKAGNEAPHKRILLLSVIDAIEKGIIKSPIIILTPELKSIFKFTWQKLVPENSLFQPNPETPYRYMASAPFWKTHSPNSSGNPYNEEIASIDQELFELFSKENSRVIFKEILEQRVN